MEQCSIGSHPIECLSILDCTFTQYANCNLYCIVSIGCTYTYITDVTVMSGDGYVFIV